MNILIVEDEQQAAFILKSYIEWHHKFQVVCICDGIETSVDYLREHQNDLDLIFMDIQLSDGQCFEIFEKISIYVPVVFCTSYNEYMLEAFKNKGIDYILKPFDAQDIRQTITKVERLKGSFLTHDITSNNFKINQANS